MIDFHFTFNLEILIENSHTTFVTTRQVFFHDQWILRVQPFLKGKNRFLFHYFLQFHFTSISFKKEHSISLLFGGERETLFRLSHTLSYFECVCVREREREWEWYRLKEWVSLFKRALKIVTNCLITSNFYGPWHHEMSINSLF